MPASRWNSSILEMLNWLAEEQSALEELISLPIIPYVVQNESDEEAGADSVEDDERHIPTELPVLPLRGLVVYPQTAVPLTIGQARSIRLVDDVMSGDERLIALVTSLAVGSTSTAYTRTPGRAWATARPMAPEPQPMSAT